MHFLRPKKEQTRTVALLQKLHSFCLAVLAPQIFSLIAVLFLFQTPLAQARLSEVALFSKCYSKLNDKRPTPNHPVRISVKNGEISAEKACAELLDLDKGKLSNAQQGFEQRRILNTLHRFHQSWFEGRGYLEVFNQVGEIVRDVSEPALFVTRELIRANPKYSDILKGSTPLTTHRMRNGVVNRESTKQQALTEVRNECRQAALDRCFLDQGAVASGGDFSKSAPWNNVRYLPIGEIVDVVDNSPMPIQYRNRNNDLVASLNTVESIGGGIIGSQIFRLFNERVSSQAFNGETVARNWSKAIFRDLMCRDLPVLRYSDGQPFVVPNSTIAYRQSQSCVHCHATVDRMAGVMRNHRVVTAGSSRINGNLDHRTFHTFVIYPFPQSQPAQSGWAAERDPNYHQRPPTGQLYYRSFDGKLVLNQVNGANELGQAIASQEDLYACAAKRYYEFLTGHKTTLADIADPSYSAILTDADLFHRNEVIRLGRSLKTHQSLKKLIADIFSTKAFRESSQGEN